LSHSLTVCRVTSTAAAVSVTVIPWLTDKSEMCSSRVP
jgi:hypothetical protein